MNAMSRNLISSLRNICGVNKCSSEIEKCIYLSLSKKLFINLINFRLEHPTRTEPQHDSEAGGERGDEQDGGEQIF